MLHKITLTSFVLFLAIAAQAQTLGTYLATSTGSGRSLIVTPTAVPANVVGMLVTCDPEFQGVLSGNPTTGKIRITNPKPAGTYTIRVKGYSAGGTVANKYFQLVVHEPDCNVGELTPGTVVTTGLNQIGAVVGDFNQDGFQDIAAAHEGGNNTLSIRIGTGTGNFTGTLELPVGSHPYNVAVADIDRDGTQDLVTVNSGDNAITPILGNGNGTFIVKPVCDVGFAPISLVIADFDADGKPDVATANLNSNTISLRQGNGGGFFYGTTEIPVGTNPYHIALGDFNGDGKWDLATANSSDNDVSIRMGNGGGGFTSKPDVSVGQNPLCVVVADFNEDGNEDIATANFVVNAISIRFGDGTGNFSGNVEIPTGLGAYFLAVGNYNGDDHTDMVIANYFDNTVSMRFGDGTGGFVNGNDIPVGSYPTGVTVGEFNQDHYMDIVASNYNDGAVSVHLGMAGLPSLDSVHSNAPICEGTDLMLSATGGLTYAWVGPNGFASTNALAQRNTTTLADSGIYQVTIQDSGHCVMVKNLPVTIYPSPVVAFFLSTDTFCSSDAPIQLTGGIPQGGTYVGTGMINYFFDPQLAGPGSFTINYVFADEHDCTASDSEKVWVFVCAATEELNENKFIDVYPNPTRDEVYIHVSDKDATVLLYSADGMLVRRWKMQAGSQLPFYIGDLPSGIYSVRILDNEQVFVSRLIKN